MHPNRTIYAQVALAGMMCMGLTGCLAASRATVSTLCGNDSYNEKYINKLTKQRDGMRYSYKLKVSNFKTKRDKYKKEINAAIKKRDLKTAILKTTSLHAHMNPCKYNKCGKQRGYMKRMYPNAYQKMENVIEKEDLRENDFVEDAIARTEKILPVMIKKKEFLALDDGLAWLKKYPANKKMKASFYKVKTNTKKLWLAQLKKDIAATKEKTPGAALMYMVKAFQLANTLNDTSSRQSIGGQLKSTRAMLIRQHGFVYNVGQLSGGQSEKIGGPFRRPRFRQRISHSASNNNRTDAVLSVSVGSPSHSRRKSSKQGSFKYKSGTKPVPNPALRGLQNDLKRAQSALKHDQEACANFRKRKAAGQTSASNSTNCQDIENEQEKVNRIRSKISSTPKTIEKDVFSDYDYPITVHHLSSSMRFSAKLVGRLGTASNNQSLGASLSDEEHGRYSKNGSGVQADPANPPSFDSGVSALNSLGRERVSGLIIQLFNKKRAGYLNSRAQNGDVRMHNLMIYLLLDPKGVPKKVIQELEQRSKTSNMARLLETL